MSDDSLAFRPTMYNRVFTWVEEGGAEVTNAFYSHNACWYMRALNNNGNEHRR